MNVFIHDLRFGLKSFLIWSMVLFVFVFAGMVKYTGVEAGGMDAVDALINSFPKILLAVMGFSGLDVSGIDGFYAILEVYVMIVAALYAVHLGQVAVSRERVDGTYEFLFTKPRSRSSVLGEKILAGLIFLIAFSLLNFAFSQAGYAQLGLSSDMSGVFAVFSAALAAVSFTFFGLGAMLSALFRSPEVGARAGNLSVLVFYMIGVVCSSMDDPTILRYLTPFKFFDPHPLMDQTVELFPVILCLVVGATSLAIAFACFCRRDLPSGAE